MGADALRLRSGSDPADAYQVCMLGRDHCEYGVLSIGEVGRHSAAAISVGATSISPSNRFKTDDEVPNEDALCVVESSHLGFYAVADAHYGPESSHTLVSRLHQGAMTEGTPRSVSQLADLLDSLQDGMPPETESETTLLVVVHDRSSHAGFGISFGDSTFMVVGQQNRLEPVNRRNSRFVSTSPDQLPLEGAAFQFRTSPGDLLLTFTDGIDECHYRSPETSVRPHHIAQIVAETAGNPLATVTEMAGLALTGVGGNPGGQDNIALIASSA